MNDQITPKQIERLRRDLRAPDLRDVHCTVVATYKGTRRRTDGQDKHITVEIGREDDLWFVQATDEDNRTAVGNPQHSLDHAIEMVKLHWRRLDDDYVP